MTTSSLDGVLAIRHYVDRIVSKCSGMKVLLLDALTTAMVSAVYSQTEILSNQVYLVSKLEDRSQKPPPQLLKAVVLIRATASNIDRLAQELHHPRFGEYQVYLTGIVNPSQLKLLAESDVMEKVSVIQELYADYVPINPDLVTLQCRSTLAMTVAAGTSWAPKFAMQYERHLQGLQSLLLSFKRQPSCIRYAGNSPCAEELAKDLHESMQQDDVFSFRRASRGGGGGGGGLLLLILDRRDDPVTPLLSQWTYQAMVHELLGLNNQRVVLKGVAPNVSKDLEQVVLGHDDDFFVANRHKNFGELGEQIQRLLQEYQKQTAQTDNLNSIEAMQSFMEKFPELRSRSHAVSKHVAIMGELARLVQVCSLMDVSQFEQELACGDDHNAHWRELMDKLGSPSIKIPDKLRLGLLYALRYEVSGNIHMVQSAMSKGGVPQDLVNLVPVMLRYAGMKSRGPGLYGDGHNLMSKMTKSFITSVQGIENVYAQHVPVLMDTIHAILKGKLSLRTHPVVPGSTQFSQPDQVVPEEIIVFMVGGVTYEEGTKVAEFNASMKGRVSVLLAGSTVHNSTSFLDELKATSL